MKDYMKMSDFIVGDVSVSMNHNGDVSVQYDYADPDMVVRKTMDAMEHAINSHDDLVAEVGRLVGIIQAIKNPSSDDCLQFLCAAFRHCDYSIEGDFEIDDIKPAFILYANRKGA